MFSAAGMKSYTSVKQSNSKCSNTFGPIFRRNLVKQTDKETIEDTEHLFKLPPKALPEPTSSNVPVGAPQKQTHWIQEMSHRTTLQDVAVVKYPICCCKCNNALVASEQISSRCQMPSCNTVNAICRNTFIFLGITVLWANITDRGRRKRRMKRWLMCIRTDAHMQLLLFSVPPTNLTTQQTTKWFVWMLWDIWDRNSHDVTHDVLSRFTCTGVFLYGAAAMLRLSVWMSGIVLSGRRHTANLCQTGREEGLITEERSVLSLGRARLTCLRDPGVHTSL